MAIYFKKNKTIMRKLILMLTMVLPMCVLTACSGDSFHFIHYRNGNPLR